MTIRVEINGYSFTSFKDYDIQGSVEDVSGSFHLTFAAEYTNIPPFAPEDSVGIFINNIKVLTGHIDVVNPRYSNNSHEINIIGRDNVADLVDSTVGTKIEFKAPVTLPQILQSVIKQIRLTKVGVINNVSGLQPFGKSEIASGEIDETIFSFLEKYTRKRQVLMTTDGLGNLVLTRAGSVMADAVLRHTIDTNDNNILSAEISTDHTERFYEYRVHSQGNPAALKTATQRQSSPPKFPAQGQSIVDFLDVVSNWGKGSKSQSNKELVTRTAVAYDPEIRTSRILDITAESSTDTPTLQKRALWEVSVRRARAFSYTCTVQGHLMTPNGKPWRPNLRVILIDDFEILPKKQFIIKSVKYTLSDKGSMTELELVDPDSYLPEPIVEKQKKGKKKKGRKANDDGFYTDLAKKIRSQQRTDLPIDK